MTRLTTLTQCVRLVVRLMPAGTLGDPSGDEVLSTIRRACIVAKRDRGWLASVRTALSEIADLVRTVLRARLGRRPAVTTASRHDGPSRKPGRSSWLERLTRDIRQAVRSLARTRGYAAITIGMLALGIGINAAVFTILDSVLWRPVPYRDADRLVELYNYNTARGFSYIGFSPVLVNQWRTQHDLVEALEAFDRVPFVYRTPAGTEMVSGALVTPRLLSLLGVTPRLGRVFTDNDGRPGTDRVVVVSESFWRARLGATREIETRDVDLNGRLYRVIGVMPVAFRFPESRDLWVPYDIDQPPPDAPLAPRTLIPVARLAAGVTFDKAGPEAIARGGRLNAAAGGTANVSARMMPLGHEASDVTRRSLTLLGGAVCALLLIICANVASLTLARGLDRARDVAVRVALGATRADLFRSRLIEHAIVGALGTLLGIAVARAGIAAALAVLPDAMTETALNAITVDTRMLLLTIGVGVLTVFVFGLPPALLGSRATVADALRKDGRTLAGSRLTSRWRSALLISEVGLAALLLIVGAVLTRSLIRLQSTDHGFDTDNLVVVTIGLPAAGYADREVRDRFAVDAANQIRKIGNVTGVTIGGLPLDFGAVTIGELEIGDHPGDRLPQMIVPIFEVPPDYFSTLKIPLRTGRSFTADDPQGSVVVSSHLAAQIRSGGDALGARFRLGEGPWLTIVGIAGDVPVVGDNARAPLAIYSPLGHESGAFHAAMSTSLIADYRTLVIRSANPAAARPAIGNAIHAIDPSVVIWKTSLVDHVYADAIARPRAVFLLMAVFGIAGLATAAAGLYGVLVHLVTQRRREIGIRLALGARTADVGRLVFARGLALTATGVAIGVAAAWLLTRAWQSLLVEVAAIDPVSVAVVVAVIMTAAALASWRPAQRAMRVDPVALLREDG